MPNIPHRLDTIARWLQQEDDAILYEPDIGVQHIEYAPPRLVYILDGHTPVHAPSLEAWADWLATADRCVCQTAITPDITVSTVFLGLDHGYGMGPPLLFETMACGSEDGYQVRCSTWDEAEAWHAAVVGRVMKDLYGDNARLHTEGHSHG